MAKLDKMRTEMMASSAVILQRHARGFIARRKYQRTRRAVISIQVTAASSITCHFLPVHGSQSDGCIARNLGCTQGVGSEISRSALHAGMCMQYAAGHVFTGCEHMRATPQQQLLLQAWHANYVILRRHCRMLAAPGGYADCSAG